MARLLSPFLMCTPHRHEHTLSMMEVINHRPRKFYTEKEVGFFFFLVFFGLHLNNSIPTARHSKQAQSSNTQFTVITLQILHYFVRALGTLGAATGRGPILSFLGIITVSLTHVLYSFVVSLTSCYTPEIQRLMLGIRVEPN